jgi:chaperonin cofactor prefoldin
MTDKERLEEINGLLDEFHNAKSDSQKLKIVNKVIWEHTIELIGQVAYLEQRVEELETQLSINTNNMKHLQNKIERYKQALEFYADEENYKPFDGIFLSSYQNKVDEDGGEIARQALEGDND